MNWFEVDKEGLAKLQDRKPKEFVLFELVQNAWDENTTRVEVTLERVPGTRYAQVIVTDDNPEGFHNLSHAFTLFAESAKKNDASKRGRFNLGEKLVLALCNKAVIASTKGTVIFDSKGRHQSPNKTVRGSVFQGTLKMTNEEIERCGEAMRTLIRPEHITTYYNGVLLNTRTPIQKVETPLQTEIADADGYLRRTVRNTVVEIYEPLPGEEAWLYELGIPVVKTEDKWHLNVMQKVPLNVDRDNVTPTYLARVRALAVEAMHDKLTANDANNAWVREAFQRHGDDMTDETVRTLTELRFGKKAVVFDPSDPEANALAVSKGFLVVHGNQMSKDEWDHVRRVEGLLLPAGKVTPSPKPFSEEGKPLTYLDESKWTPAMRSVIDYMHAMAIDLIGCTIDIKITNEMSWPHSAAYGQRLLIINAARLGHSWFEGSLEPINDLMIHEFGHHYSLNHLDDKFYRALTRLGAKLTTIALKRPDLFKLAQREAA